MKKFVLKLFLFLLPVCLFLILNVMYKKTNYYKSREHNTYRFTQVPENIQLCNVGSSHGEVGFYWEDMQNINTFNFGISSQPFLMDYCILQQYSAKLARGAIVIIPISYFQITQIEEPLCWYTAYYKFLRKDLCVFWNNSDYLAYNLFPILSDHYFLKHMIFDIPKEQISRFYRRTIYPNPRKMTEYIDKKYLEWTNPLYEKGIEGFNYNLKHVSQIIDFCYLRGFTPVLVTTPIYEELNSRYAAKLFHFYRFIKTLQQKYPDIYYFDYSHHSSFSPRIELFMDGDHLNIHGAKLFTSMIMNDLKKAHLLDAY